MNNNHFLNVKNVNPSHYVLNRLMYMLYTTIIHNAIHFLNRSFDNELDGKEL